ncbi:hypothetical protein [Prosthecomicrobium hirschii]|nr:hypothetical protein [Prosthecomicrobium hirschii]
MDLLTAVRPGHPGSPGGSFPLVQFTGDVTIPEVACTIIGTTFDSKAAF